MSDSAPPAGATPNALDGTPPAPAGAPAAPAAAPPAAAAPAPAAAPAAPDTPADPATDPAAKPADEAVDYTFEAPEGIELDPARTDEFVAIAKELKLPKEAAQKVVDIAVRMEQQRVEQHAQLVTGWADEVKADKEIGGDKLPETLAVAKKAIDMGPPELKALLDSTGMGNHPAVVRWAYAVGKALDESHFTPGGNQPPNAGKTTAQRMYPNMAP